MKHRKSSVVIFLMLLSGIAQAALLEQDSEDVVIRAAQRLMAQGEGAAAVRNLLPEGQHGNAEAAYWLGRLYFYDEAGVRRDYAVAATWFTQAARAGHAGAQYKLAGMYFTGRGVDQNPSLALQWWIAAARQGHAESLNNLGALLATGQGVVQDADLGMAMQILAAEKGSEAALENLQNKGENAIARALANRFVAEPEMLDRRLSMLQGSDKH